LRVLAKARREGGQIPIRQIQVLSNTVDPPAIQNMLRYGSRLLKELGLDRDTDSCHLLADRYGRLLRKLGAFITIGKVEIQPHMAARVALFYLLNKTDPEKAVEARRRFPFSKNLYSSVLRFIVLLDHPNVKGRG